MQIVRKSSEPAVSMASPASLPRWTSSNASGPIGTQPASEYWTVVPLTSNEVSCSASCPSSQAIQNRVPSN